MKIIQMLSRSRVSFIFVLPITYRVLNFLVAVCSAKNTTTEQNTSKHPYITEKKTTFSARNMLSHMVTHTYRTLIEPLLHVTLILLNYRIFYIWNLNNHKQSFYYTIYQNETFD